MTTTLSHIRRVPKLVAAVILALIVFGLAPVHAQLSPGKLASPHESLEGLTNCTKCHELGEGPSADKCLACHTTVRARIKAGAGLHHRYVTVEGKACFECHSDHAGREFKLVTWPGGIKKFDHTSTGFTLEGKHATLQCRDCHQPGNIKEPLRAEDQSIDLTRTYFGLRRDCLSCHVDQHRAQLGDNCLKCHTQDKWKPATGFDHNRTAFVLTGKHRRVDCAKCHKSQADPNTTDPKKAVYVTYTGLAHKVCTNCHRDKHEGKFGADCTQCHQTSGWKQLTMVKGDFNHDKTAFPLRGRHTAVACDKCHRSGTVLGPMKHDRCVDCHSDIHRGQFASRADGGKCEACHTVDGFLPALYTIADHQKTKFQLAGAHLAQPCIACHKTATDSKGEYRVFTVEDFTCTGCHTDIHRGQFAVGEPVRQCTDCHNIDDWHKLKFNHDSDTEYKLVGAHKRVKCDGCHTTVAIDGASVTRYRGLDTDCRSCHMNGRTLSPLE